MNSQQEINPIAGELWYTVDGWYVLVTKVGEEFINYPAPLPGETFPASNKSPWVWWDNLNVDVEGNASLEWFLRNCKKVS